MRSLCLIRSLFLLNFVLPSCVTIAILPMVTAPPCLAEDHAIIIDDSKPGTFLLEVKADGSVSVRPLKVTRVGTPSSPTTPDNKPFQQSVQDLTKKTLDAGGSKTTGAGIAAVYSLVSSGLSDGSIALDKWVEAINTGTNAILATQGDAAKWKPFRDDLSKVFTQLSNDKLIDTKSELVAALKDVSLGMNAATGFDASPAQAIRLDPDKAGILDGIDLAKLIELIKMIMELMKLFKS